VESGPATPAPRSYWLTRFCILRLLGLVYLVAFLVFVLQAPGLIGSRGLLPAGDFLARVAAHAGGAAAAWGRLPTVFWLGASDAALLAVGWAGVTLAALVVAGLANVPIMAALWALYLSIVHVGQEWYGYGWEIQLLETGFLAIFLCPLLDARPFPRHPPPVAVIWLLRWLIVRIMLGAGLIKLRGDPCWRDLTCLVYHYETQPLPGPLARALHLMPLWLHRLGALWTHVTELVLPWLVIGPRAVRQVAGVLLVAFQGFLILSGNLSFLNWLTIVPCLACLDDGLWARVLPRALAARAAAVARAARAPSLPARLVPLALAALVAVLSVAPVANLLSPRQAMNTSFDRLHLVNTYGAFGSVGRERLEIVYEGTRDEIVTDDTRWQAYEFRCKPGDPGRRPCQVSPYHYRLDWQIWFAAMSTPDRHPWTMHLVWKLLQGEPAVLRLLATNPFPDAPPRYVRAVLYRYAFAPPDDPTGAWWRREPVTVWFPAFEPDDIRFQAILRRQGWVE